MSLADLDDMAALLGDPLVMKYYNHPKSRVEAREWIEWNQRLYRERGHGLWLLRRRDTDAFVGDCGLTPQEVQGEVSIEVGYHVRAELQGQGYATEAAAACRAYAAAELGLGRLIAIIDPANEPSQRVATKIGLRLDRRALTKQGTECLVFAGDASGVE
jgi:RimJ/RimL family protein N-acetyltransferase